MNDNDNAITRFFCEQRSKLDDQGRAAVPATIRNELLRIGENKFFIRKDTFKRFLRLYVPKEFDKFINEIKNEFIKYGDNEGFQEWHIFLKGCFDVTLDGAGRICLPRPLLEYIQNTKKEVVFLGCSSYIELWNADSYYKEFNIEDIEDIENTENPISVNMEDPKSAEDPISVNVKDIIKVYDKKVIH